ncbi:hypothetical protein GQ602_003798 [Ophiocordyceps camponoti-floridani]|uniref:Uncharacterized protein n=1 Tax=Ophiocordyceps camponoti-floridani TaxID=2030778 RepID=A0A8H4Q8T4_9HYPO|nr:hypothetical protein GQ602_003798 [Ophiocordyceps camponoti-floridani]
MHFYLFLSLLLAGIVSAGGKKNRMNWDKAVRPCPTNGLRGFELICLDDDNRDLPWHVYLRYDGVNWRVTQTKDSGPGEPVIDSLDKLSKRWCKRDKPVCNDDDSGVMGPTPPTMPLTCGYYGFLGIWFGQGHRYNLRVDKKEKGLWTDNLKNKDADIPWWIGGADYCLYNANKA